MKNSERKKELLNQDNKIVSNYGQKRYDLVSNGVCPDTLTAQDFGLNELDYECLEQMRNAKKSQRERINKHIDYWTHLELNLCFITLTLNDYALSLKYETRKKILTRIMAELKHIFPDYIANIDYGAINEREHYHMVAPYNSGYDKPIPEHPNQIDIEPLRSEWLKYGFIYIEPVRKTDGLAGYIAKLVSHSIKVKQTKLITPKNTPYQAHQQQIKADRLYHKNIVSRYNCVTRAIMTREQIRANDIVFNDLPF